MDDRVAIKSVIRRIAGHRIECRYVGGRLLSIAPAPFVMLDMEPWPWDRMGYSLAHRMMLPLDPRSIIYTDPKAQYAWWDGSCLVTALVKEGPKEMVPWKPR